MSDYFPYVLITVVLFSGFFSILLDRNQVGVIKGVVLIFLAILTFLLNMTFSDPANDHGVLAFIGLVLINTFFIILIKLRQYLFLFDSDKQINGKTLSDE